MRRAAVPIYIMKTDHIGHYLPCARIDLIAVSVVRRAVGFRRLNECKTVNIRAFEVISAAMRFVRESCGQLIFR